MFDSSGFGKFWDFLRLCIYCKVCKNSVGEEMIVHAKDIK